VSAAIPSATDRLSGLPPFDLLDQRRGKWQARRKEWLAIGLDPSVGRPGRLLLSTATSRDPSYYQQFQAAKDAAGRDLTAAEFEADQYRQSASMAGGGAFGTGTSQFDPVLCELAYRWWTAPGWLILDPFAGGPTRGVVAAVIGRRYIGCDLSAAQVEANRAHCAELAMRGIPSLTSAEWAHADAARWVDSLDPGSVDFVWTCPPYLWTERYSDDPADLSTMTVDQYERALRRIVDGAACALRADRFAGLVIGDVRARDGRLIDLRGMAIRAFEDAGLHLVSAAVLIPPCGTSAMRGYHAMRTGRSLGRGHQHTLIFVKGSRRAATSSVRVDDRGDWR